MNSQYYICSCSNSLLTSSDLRNHLRISKVHKIRLTNSGIYNNYYKELRGSNFKQIKSIQNLHNKEVEKLELNILSRFSKSILNINKNQETIIKNISTYQIKDFIRKNLENPTGPKDSAQFNHVKSLQNSYNTLKILEVSKFKHKKSKIVSNFKDFMKYHPSLILKIQISEDSKYILTSSKDGFIRIHELLSVNLIKTFNHFSESISSFDLSHDNSYIISGTNDSIIRLWDFNSNKL